MPSPQAQRETSRHRRELATLTSAVVRAVRQVAGRADVADIDAWWQTNAEGVVAAVSGGSRSAATLAVGYLGRHARAEGVDIDPERVFASSGQVETALRVTGPVAYKQHVRAGGTPEQARRAMQTVLSGAAGRLVMAGARDTIHHTIESSAEIVGYRRVTSSGACAFCLMLASRGAAYTTAAAAATVGTGRVRGTREPGQEYHDYCRCEPEPLYEHEPEPEDVQRLQDEWIEATRGLGGTDALNAWRRHIAASRH